MNIPKVKAEGYVPPAKAKPQAAKASPAKTAGDVFKPEQNQKLMEKIHNEPDIRPDVVERARLLVADSTYPSPEVVKKTAQGLLGEIENSK